MVVTNPRQRPRTCVGCREESPKRALIRIVRTPEGGLALDERGKLAGRGAYLCASLECLKAARKTKALSRALKTDVPEGFYDTLEDYIEGHEKKADSEGIKKELRLLLGLSRRAGLVHIGTDSVKSQGTKESLLILTASDSSVAVADFAEKMASGSSHETFCMPLDVEDLSAAIGAGRVQAIALPRRNGLADKIKMLLEEGGVALE